MSGARLRFARVGGALAVALVLAAALLVACGGGNGNPNPSVPASASALAAEPLLREGCRERGGYCGMLTPGGRLTAATWLDHDRMYLADLAGRIRLLNVETGEMWTVRTGLSMPQGLTVLHGRLYVTDMGSVCRGMREEPERLEAAGFDVFSSCNLNFKGRITDVTLKHLGKYTARVLSYRIDGEGNLDDEMVVLDRIIAIDREHSPNGLTNDGEYVYVSIGHPLVILENHREQLRDLALRYDLMGVIARLDSSGDVEVYATGFRNVYGISAAPDGTIYGADNDEGAGLTTSGHREELNAIRKGAFYGYPAYGTNEAPPDKNITEPVAILQGFGSTATYANEDGVYVAYAAHVGETVRHVVDRFDYEMFYATRIYEDVDYYYTDILEQDSLLYLISLAGDVHVIDPMAAPVSIRTRISSAEVRQILASTPVITSEYYDVYLDESLPNSRIIYVKNSCVSDENTFVLHVYPIQNNDLPIERRVHGFENLDFFFDRYGWIEDNMCIAMRYLPSYKIDYFVVGQYSASEDGRLESIWNNQLSLPSSFYLTSGEMDEIVASDPVIQSEYDIYLHNSHLVYVGESCADEGKIFSLHVYPVRVDDLPVARRPIGFENLDFSVEQYGWIKNDMCVVMRPLPSYDIDYLTTGQYKVEEIDGQTEFETVWMEELSFRE